MLGPYGHAQTLQIPIELQAIESALDFAKRIIKCEVIVFVDVLSYLLVILGAQLTFDLVM